VNYDVLTIIPFLNAIILIIQWFIQKTGASIREELLTGSGCIAQARLEILLGLQACSITNN
jgi:hypothetical protein